MDTNINRPENLYKISRILLRLLNVSVTRTTSHRFLGSENSDGSLADLTYALNQWKIDSLAVKIHVDQLMEIDLPAVIHMTDSGNTFFVVLTNVKDGVVYYLDSELGSQNESMDDFARKWGGIALLIAPDFSSGENEYAKHRRKELLADVQAFLPIIIVVLCLCWGIAQLTSWSAFLLFSLKIAGVAFSVALLWREHGPENPLLDKFCKVHHKADCNSVLSSPAAKPFGWVGMSEIGFVYFLGGFLVIFISSLGYKQTHYISILAMLSILTAISLPYTLFSIYYQGWVIRQWCLLCVIILTLIWLELLVGLNWMGKVGDITISSLILFLVCFSLPIAFWLFLKPFVKNTQKILDLSRELNHFRKDTNVFQFLLDSGPPCAIVIDKNELILGNPNAPVTLLMVSGLFCTHCAQAHQTIEQLLSKHPEDLRVAIRFVTDVQQDRDFSEKVIQHLFALMNQNPERLAEALVEWYQTQDFGNLVTNYPVLPTQSEKDILIRHTTWIQETEILYTPTFFINNRPLPSYFEIMDLEYHVQSLAWREINSTTDSRYFNEGALPRQ